jgi:hypothetical protein
MYDFLSSVGDASMLDGVFKGAAGTVYDEIKMG